MALKQLMITRKRAEANAKLEALREKWAEYEQRRADMEKREAELEAAINEVTEETPEEEKAEAEKAVEEFEAEREALEKEIADCEAEKRALEDQIAQLDAELKELNERAKTPPAPPAARENEQRKDEKTMNTRTKFFGMTMQERDAFLGRQEIKDFLQRVREMGKRASTITGKELLIPEVGLELLREQTVENSRLLKHVNLRRIKGNARQRIMGAVPEGVWTEMCAKLNELTLSFGQIELDGYKVGGFIAVCNAVLEDSDVALATEIFSALAQALAIAIDKAILYGTGTKMPMGIATRIAQTQAPSDWGENAPEWKDISATNSITIDSSKTGTKLFQAIVAAAGASKSRYATGERFWAMTDATYMKLVGEAITMNAAGAIVSSMNRTMPVIGGAVEIMSDDVMADNTIIGGYGNLYLMVERAGTTLGQSEHVRFLDDETVFKATARYDGAPVFGEAFVAIGLGAAPTMTATFAPDLANAGD